MSEQYGKLIDEAVDDFWEARAGIGSPPGGAKAVRRRVMRKREIIITTWSVLGVLMVITPIAVYATSAKRDVPLRPPLTSMSPTGPSFPVDPLTIEIAAANPKMPDGVPCPMGAGRLLHQGQSNFTSPGLQSGAHAFIDHAVKANMDDDAELELVAEISCTAGAGGSYGDYVVALDRDKKGKLFGSQVIADVRGNENFDGLVAKPAGGVIVLTKRSAPEWEDVDIRVQRREFGWTGMRIEQIAGPIAFPRPSTADLKLTTSKLELGPAVNGKRTGTLTLTVENIGEVVSDQIQVVLEHPGNYIEVTPRFWVWTWAWLWGTDEPRSHSPLDPGEEATMTVQVVIDDTGVLEPFTASVFTGGGDPHFENNVVKVVPGAQTH